jgi:hypothetical protein
MGVFLFVIGVLSSELVWKIGECEKPGGSWAFGEKGSAKLEEQRIVVRFYRGDSKLSNHVGGRSATTSNPTKKMAGERQIGLRMPAPIAF